MFYLDIYSFIGQTQAQSGVPFPNQSPGTPTNFGATVSTSTIEKAKDLGNAAASSLNDAWDTLVSPLSPLYSGLIEHLSPLVAIGFLFWAIIWARDMYHQGYSSITMQQLVWPLIIIIMLANNGTLLAATTNGARVLISNVNNSILDSSSKGITNRQHIQLQQLDQSARKIYNSRIQKCNPLRDLEKQKCEEEVKIFIQTYYSQALSNNAGLPQVQQNSGFLQQLGTVITGTIKLGIMGIISGFLIGLSGAFRWFIAFALLIWSSTGPFWLSITLLPQQTKGLIVFLTGIISLGSINIAYTIINVGAALTLATASNADPLIYPLVTGLLGPLFAVGVGLGSAVGVFTGAPGAALVISRAGAQLLR